MNLGYDGLIKFFFDLGVLLSNAYETIIYTHSCVTRSASRRPIDRRCSDLVHQIRFWHQGLSRPRSKTSPKSLYYEVESSTFPSCIERCTLRFCAESSKWLAHVILYELKKKKQRDVNLYALRRRTNSRNNIEMTRRLLFSRFVAFVT